MAVPPLIEDEVDYVTYSRSSDTVADPITLTFGIKLVSGGIPTDGMLLL